MITLAVWVALGTVIGIVASALLQTDRADQSRVANVGASVVGAIAGGAVAYFFGHSGSTLAQVLSFETVLFSGVGAMLAVFVVNIVRNRQHHPLNAGGTPRID
jgi:uncharacterized membrane protein YeaQ/YmgE (transglycosylase-associated protein family)